MDRERGTLDRASEESGRRHGSTRRNKRLKDQDFRFNTRYKEIRKRRVPKYMLKTKKREEEWIKSLARVKCGSEDAANKNWLGGGGGEG